MDDSPTPDAPAARRRSDRIIAAAVGLVVGFVSLFLYADAFGLTYDEPVYAAVGERHLGWYERLFTFDTRAFDPLVLEQHWGNVGSTAVEADWQPPVGKVLLAVGRRLPVGGLFARYRLANVLLFALTAAVLFYWVAGVAGRTAGAAAALAWVTMPRAVAHGNLASIDMPATAFATIALWQAWRVGRRPTWAGGAWFGLWLALSASSKFNGVLVVPIALGFALWRARGALGPLALGSFAVAPLLGWLLWPWLWYDGLTHLRQVVAFHWRHGYIATEYFGTVYGEPPPPWHYPLVMLALTTPVLTLLTALFGLGGLLRRAPDDHPPLGDLTRLLALALLVHLLPFMMPNAAKYNGVRLFLPALAVLAALSGLGLGTAVRLLRARPWPMAGWLVPGLALLLAYLPAQVGLLGVYPYPMAFYNPLVGGPAGADRAGFELSYWGDPFRGAAAWLSREAPPGAAVYFHPPGAQSMVAMYRAAGLLREDIRLVGDPAEADVLVYQNRRSEWDDTARALADTPPLQGIEASDGAPVAIIWRARAAWAH